MKKDRDVSAAGKFRTLYSCTAYLVGVLTVCILHTVPLVERASLVLADAFGCGNGFFSWNFWGCFKVELLMFVLLMLSAHSGLGFISCFFLSSLAGAVTASYVFGLLKKSASYEFFFEAGTVIGLCVFSFLFIFAAGKAAGISGQIFRLLVFGRQRELSTLYGQFLREAFFLLICSAAGIALGALIDSLIITVYGKIN